MAQQNINQYVYPKLKISFALDTSDMSLSSDEVDYNQEVVFSPYLIAQTYGNRLPVYYDLNSSNTTQNLTLYYGQYDYRNLVVSENYYNPDNLDLTCFSAQSACDIGLVGMDNGLVTSLVGQTITFTNGLFNQTEKFQRTYFDRRMKMFQVTGYTSQYNRFSGIPKNTLYEIESAVEPNVGKYHKLYGGFYQGFYKLFGYDYEALPERTNKGWSVEMLLKPRIINDRIPGSGDTTLNEIYPDNKNTFFYLGTRAENKFYHHADGHPRCFTGYTRVTSGLTDCLVTCACCNTGVTNSRCIFVYPPRSVDGIHDYHINYGCDVCKEQKRYCGCDCGEEPCGTCGWECKTHPCALITGVTPTPMPIVPLICKPCEPSPTPTPTPSPTPIYCETTPVCEHECPDCDTCDECIDCITCATTGYTSIEDTCEKDPLWDSISNAFSVKFSGDPRNPKICVKVLRFTGDCVTTGSCETTGVTQMTGYTIDTYCSPNGIYDYCLTKCDTFFDLEKWMLVDVVWRRYTWLDTCDLQWRGGLGDITEVKYLDSLVNDTTKLIKPPYTHENCSIDPETIELVKLNQKWLNDLEFRMGRLKIYVNGKPFFTIENFEEIIPRPLDTDKERQIGVPFNMSWGGGTQGLHENLVFSSCTLPYTDYIQDPELFPENILSGTTLAGMRTNILLEQNFGGTFEGGISQFRMYVDPLTAPEIKHNFKILKDRFSMFDPDCPDCNPVVCDVNDFEYNVIDTTPTPTPTPTITPSMAPDLCCPEEHEAPLTGNSVVISGITITGSGTGRITPFSTSVPVKATCESKLMLYTNTVELGDNSLPYTGPTNFSYTMTFSSPVNHFLIHLIDYTTPETFTITTNLGNPVIVPCEGCCYNIINNTITVGPPATGCNNPTPSTYGGSGKFTISTSTPYTSVTITGPGGGGGTNLKICSFETIFLPTPTSTPTLTPTPTSSQVVGNNLCGPPCGLGFDTYSSNTVGQLVVGSITGGCGSITSYVIYWYDSNNVLQLVSGFGPLIPGYTPYTVTHPLTGGGSPPLPAGQYTPVLQAITIAGVTYTSTGLSGTTEANLNCFTNVDLIVQSFSCENCTEVGHYKCRKSYTTTPGSLVPAGTLSTTFALDPSQPYFAYAFKGETIPDTLKITFVNADGTNYNSPIVIEYINLGLSVVGDSDLSINTIPKRLETGTSTSYYAKPLNLTNFNINNGDYLIIEVIPNTGITQTSWDLYFTCLETFDCDTCLETNIPFKISASTLSFSVDPTCNILNVNGKVIGCPSYANEDIFKYMHSVSNPYLDTFFTAIDTSFYPRSTYYGLAGFNGSVNVSFNGGCTGAGYGYGQTCQSTGNTINVTKVGPTITITCSSLSDRDDYYNSYLFIYNATGWSPTPPLPNTIQYYRYILFNDIVPLNSLSTCGDGQYTVTDYKIHPSSVVTIGGGPGAYTMTINMATITNQYPASTCNSCQGTAGYFVQLINDSVNYPNINHTTTIGLRYDTPINNYSIMLLSTPTQPIGYFGGGGLQIPYYSTTTIPYSGSPLTVIPSLSATTCDFGWMNFNNLISGSGKEVQYYEQNFGSYWVQPTDINNPSYFNLWDGWPGGTLIYEVNSTYPSGNIVDPSYFI
jgi:hypothetical protein